MYLCSNQISEIKGLDNLKQLEDIYLSHNEITEIKGLDCLPNLSHISLNWNQITEIKGLESLQNLMQIDLSYNKITKVPDTSVFKNCENLSTIFFYNRKHIENIEKFKKIFDTLDIDFEYDLPSLPIKAQKKLRASEVRKKLSQRKNDF